MSQDQEVAGAFESMCFFCLFVFVCFCLFYRCGKRKVTCLYVSFFLFFHPLSDKYIYIYIQTHTFLFFWHFGFLDTNLYVFVFLDIFEASRYEFVCFLSVLSLWEKENDMPICVFLSVLSSAIRYIYIYIIYILPPAHHHEVAYTLNPEHTDAHDIKTPMRQVGWGWGWWWGWGWGCEGEGEG